AIKNTPEGSEITIGNERVDGNVIVSVCDNGPGIADEMKPHIFEMFYTGQSKIADGRRGMGLGLALCKSIIEAHNGTITLTDNHPSGCCFAISLPVAEVPVSG
ncbi:MAG: histidine kinase, partial [Lachnospiraceae bacterium]|nr:histidine kinase [Lachnospiraceae bacterium]